MYDNKTPYPQEDCPLFNSKFIPIPILYHIIDIGGLPAYLSCVQSCHLMYQLLSYRYSYTGQQCLLKIVMQEFKSNCKCLMKNNTHEKQKKREQNLLADMKELQNKYIYEILSSLCTKITSKHSNKQTIQQLINFHKMDMRYFTLDGDSEDDQSFVDSIKLFVDDDNRWNQGWIDIKKSNISVNIFDDSSIVSDIPPVIAKQITIEEQSQKEKQFQQQMLYLESALTFYACVRYSIKYFHYGKSIVDGIQNKRKKKSKKKLSVSANDFSIAWECLYLSLSPNKLRILEHYLVYKARVHGLPVMHFKSVDMNPVLDQCFRFIK